MYEYEPTAGTAAVGLLKASSVVQALFNYIVVHYLSCNNCILRDCPSTSAAHADNSFNW